MGDPWESPPGGDSGESDQNALDKLAEIAFARQLGFDIKPSGSNILAVIDELYNQYETLNQQIAANPLGPWAPEVLTPEGRQAWFLRQVTEQLSPWQTVLAPEPQLPGDPLQLYFNAVDRMMNTMMGPFPEARYMNMPGYEEAFHTLTPSSFDEYLQTQEKALKTEYMADIYRETQGRLEQFGKELAGLPTDQQYLRMLDLSQEAGLPELQSYEQFLAQKRPELETRYRYLNPLPDEPDVAFRNAFPDLYGEGQQVTPFSQFVGNAQKSLQSEYEGIVREALRAGTPTSDLPDLEEFYKQRRPELEQTFAMSGPQYTGKSRTGALAPPRRIL